VIRNLFLLLVCLLSLNAWSGDYDVSKGSSARFTAKITGGSFVGTTEKMKGTVRYDEKGNKLEEAEFTVQVESIDTGMSLRNRHMREKYMDAAKFPEIRFRSGKGISILSGKEQPIGGYVTIKGVEKPVTALVTLENGPAADPLRVKGKFNVNILDFGIEQPSMAVVKMDPAVDVTVELVLKRK
jgi:polyisoprenoid-binding protein YceI